MKYSELPPAYKKLADKYEAKHEMESYNDDIEYRFYWHRTEEGEDFWLNVCEATSVHDLPRLPHEFFEPSGTQVGGDHYTKLKIQPLEIILANDLNFLEGNVVKYVLRHRHKGMEQDLRKAIDCLEKLMEHEYGE